MGSMILIVVAYILALMGEFTAEANSNRNGKIKQTVSYAK
jgi:hypothetical protein